MPELPEVAYNKKYVEATSLHKEIKLIRMLEPKILQASEKEFEESLTGASITEAIRHGKYLFLKTSRNNFLVFHFGMTGRFDFSHEDDPPRFTRFYLEFNDNSKLFFICPRKLGKIYLADKKEDFIHEHSMGKDALDFNREDFTDFIQQKKGSIKTALTDQSSIAGIGNMYADEILFQCRIHPKTNTSDLSDNAISQLYTYTREVLETLIKSKESNDGLPSNYLTGCRKEGEKCPRCNGEIEVMKVSGRSTYFCPSCQEKSAK